MNKDETDEMMQRMVNVTMSLSFYDQLLRLIKTHSTSENAIPVLLGFCLYFSEVDKNTPGSFRNFVEFFEENNKKIRDGVDSQIDN